MKKPVKTALCLLLCAFLSLPALAEVAAVSKTLTNGAYVTSGDYTYTLLEDGSARIIDYTGDAEALTVPAELDGHLVRQIGDRAFSACFSLTSVRLPKGLTAIGSLTEVREKQAEKALSPIWRTKWPSSSAGTVSASASPV